ncbi:MAG: rhamnulokinase family protein, partial [Sphaerochaetaceae bacterium]
GLGKAKEQGRDIQTIAIDTWGVDFVLLDKQGLMIGSPMSYRDKRTEAVICPIGQEELYRRTGIQKMSFNTLYQLLALRQEDPSLLEKAEHLLMIPDYLSYRLTGCMHQEYTNATTTNLVDAEKRDWDRELIERLGFPLRLFGGLTNPMQPYGTLSDWVAQTIGYGATVLCAPSHDTASAVLGSPLSEDSAFISSGTWSLLGCVIDKPITTEEAREANFTNEGGVEGSYRFLRNLMGLWMIQSLQKEWEGNPSFDAICDAAKEAKDFPSLIDVVDNRFLAPQSMVKEITDACKDSGQSVPRTLGEFAQCIYLSLAKGYALAIESLERLTGKTFSHIAIVGGGSKDTYLDELTACMTGKKVIAGPSEGTAIGNLLSQMIASGEIKDVREARQVLRVSVKTQSFGG